MRIIRIVLLTAMLVVIMVPGASADSAIICASTTSTQNSGLFDYILPYFEKESGIKVKVVAVGTGAALEIGKRGDADMLIVHAKDDELGRPGVLFHGVTIKPGKPLIGGIIDGVPVFGLPGHPAAITVSFETFVEPLLIKMSGEKRSPLIPSRKIIRALFSRNLSSSVGREEHIRVSLEERDNALWAVPILGKSALIRTLVKADGIVVLPMNKSGIYEGEEVEVRIFN